MNEIIIRVLQNLQTKKEMSVFLEWYNASYENKVFYFQLKNIYDYCKDELQSDTDKTGESWNRLLKKLDAHLSLDEPTQANKPTIKLKMFTKYAGIAAIALILIASGIYFFLNNHNRITWIEVRTIAQSAPEKITLPDGSFVQLNASSLLRYPKKFSSKNREVYLDGEAYFDVVKDKKRTFIVHTDEQQISVLGTQFNVLGYSTDPFAVTTLISGMVKVKTADKNDKLQNEIIMHPNQQIKFDKTDQKITLTEVDAEEAMSWIKGVYSFKDIPLGEIAKRLEKIYNITILIPDETSRNEKYTGKFFARQNIEEVIHILNFKNQFDYRTSNDTIFLGKK